MRRFAGDSLDARNIIFHFDAKAADGDIPIGAEARREIFLIFKESINNLVRHSGAGRAEIALETKRDEIVLKIRDDGKGFDVGRESSGHGLLSLRSRAARLGGTLSISSSPESGTTVILRAPVA
jgi:signal transduction histidine kinase